MNRRRNKTAPIYILCILLIGICFSLGAPERSQAQPPPPPTKPAQTPVDSGLILLVAAGGGYAIKKLRDRKE